MNDMTPTHVSQSLMTTMIPPQCKQCHDPLPPPTRPNGHPREYCSIKCRQKVAWQRYGRRLKLGLVGVSKGPLVEWTQRRLLPKPFSWWVAQADMVEGTCPKCEGPLVGVYVPPTRATVNECAVVAHCRVCGGERMVLAGCAGVPYDQKEEK